MDYCLPDTGNQDECPRTAELLTQENQAENKQKSIFFQHKLSKTHFLVRLIIVLPIISNCVADLQVSAPAGSCNYYE